VNRRFVFAAVLAALVVLVAVWLLKPVPGDPAESGRPDDGAGQLIRQARAAGSPSELRRLLLPARRPPDSTPSPEVETAHPERSLDRITDAFSRLTAEERTRLAEELVVDLEDAQFSSLLPLLTHAPLPGEVLDVLMADALGRRESLALPAMLGVARVPGHPQAETAREILQLYLEADHGADWLAWQNALTAWLAANPDSSQP
jgi:hypothetical protein